jgi:hypothetical protein
VEVADAALLGLAIGAGALAKATVLVAAAPFLLFALVRAALATPRRTRALAIACVVVAVVAAVPVAPEVVRRSSPEIAKALNRYATTYLYTGLSDLPDRMLNLGRGLVRHLPSPRGLVEAVGIQGWCRPGEDLCTGLLLRPHEDNAGNPLQVVLALVAAGLAAVRWRRLPARTRGFLLAAAGSWVLFHLAFRDNTWISRLETPTFALLGLAVAVFGRRAPVAAASPVTARKGGKRAARPPPSKLSAGAWAATAAAATITLAFGTRTALENESRPPLRGGSPESLGYYANLPNVGRAHDVVLRGAEQIGCRRVGLYLGEDSYDYPLTWRAMQRGWEVRHVFGADPWPCLVFTDQRPQPAKVAEYGWTPTSLPFVFLNRGGSASAGAAAPGGG